MYFVTRSWPVGSSWASGICQPCACNSRTDAESTVYSHGENMRTWPQSRTFAPISEPASKTIGLSPRSMRWALAANPTGPAPMIATGNWLMLIFPFIVFLRYSQQKKRTIAGCLRAASANGTCHRPDSSLSPDLQSSHRSIRHRAALSNAGKQSPAPMAAPQQYHP